MNDWSAALYRTPVTVASCLLALAATATWWLGGNVSAYMMGPEFWRGELWRPFTAAYPHVDVFHLAFNLYWVWRFGTIVEGVWGSGRTGLLFAGLAAATALASHAAFEDGVGLSGVGYGLFGMLWTLRRRDTRFRGAFEDLTTWLFVAWFFLCLLLTWAGAWNVGNVAHGSGAILGWLLGRSTGNLARRKPWFGAAFGLACALSLAGAFSRSAAWAMERGLSTASLHPRERGRVLALEGVRALERGEEERAIGLFRESLRSEPANFGTWYNLGLVLAGSGREEEAAEAFRNAVENASGSEGEKPFLAEAWKFLAARVLRRGDAKGAVTLYHKALDARKDDAEAWHGLGLCLEEAGDPKAAEGAFRRALALDRGNPGYAASLGRIRGRGAKAE